MDSSQQTELSPLKKIYSERNFTYVCTWSKREIILDLRTISSPWIKSTNLTWSFHLTEHSEGRNVFLISLQYLLWCNLIYFPTTRLADFYRLLPCVYSMLHFVASLSLGVEATHIHLKTYCYLKCAPCCVSELKHSQQNPNSIQKHIKGVPVWKHV